MYVQDCAIWFQETHLCYSVVIRHRHARRGPRRKVNLIWIIAVAVTPPPLLSARSSFTHAQTQLGQTQLGAARRANEKRRKRRPAHVIDVIVARRARELRFSKSSAVREGSRASWSCRSRRKKYTFWHPEKDNNRWEARAVDVPPPAFSIVIVSSCTSGRTPAGTGQKNVSVETNRRQTKVPLVGLSKWLGAAVPLLCSCSFVWVRGTYFSEENIFSCCQDPEATTLAGASAADIIAGRSC